MLYSGRSKSPSKVNPKELSILIAEDEADVADHLSVMLKGLGHKVLAVAPDGEAAVQQALALSPDLLIMDINLPKKDGLMAAREILEVLKVPLVISTGRSDNDALEQVGTLNVQAWLNKPFGEAQLKAALAVAFTQFQIHFQAERTIEALKGSGPELPAERLGEIGLTKREAEILHWISKGKSNNEIASVVASSPRTVAKHIEHIFIKLGVDSRTAALNEAHRRLRAVG